MTETTDGLSLMAPQVAAGPAVSAGPAPFHPP